MYKLYTGSCVRVFLNEWKAKEWLNPLGDGIITDEKNDFVTIKIKGIDNILGDNDKMKLYKNKIDDIMNNSIKIYQCGECFDKMVKENNSYICPKCNTKI